jgi:hypothetical protein
MRCVPSIAMLLVLFSVVLGCRFADCSAQPVPQHDAVEARDTAAIEARGAVAIILLAADLSMTTPPLAPDGSSDDDVGHDDEARLRPRDELPQVDVTWLPPPLRDLAIQPSSGHGRGPEKPPRV